MLIIAAWVFIAAGASMVVFGMWAHSVEGDTVSARARYALGVALLAMSIVFSIVDAIP